MIVLVMVWLYLKMDKMTYVLTADYAAVRRAFSREGFKVVCKYVEKVILNLLLEYGLFLMIVGCVIIVMVSVLVVVTFSTRESTRGKTKTE